MMSSAPGLFYAYAIRSNHDSWARYLIVFANRATADEWWRAVTDSVAAGYNKFVEVKRISPQFYTHNPDVNKAYISDTLTDTRVAARFLGRVFFTLLNDRDARDLSIAPPLNYVDHISGNGFFVRSSLQQDQFWFYDGQRIVVSRDRRTKFTISLVSPDRIKQQGQVMIGTDLVSISVYNRSGYIDIQPDWSLSISEAAETLVMPFSRFDGGFEIGHDGVLYSDEKGGGDRWELA